MIFTEWNWEDAIAVAKEEAREEDREEIAKNMIKKGYSVDEVIEVTNLSRKQIKDLRRP